MAQCYSTGPSFTGPFGGASQNWVGYEVYSYRTDRHGLGTAYGKMPTGPDSDKEQQIASEWHQNIAPGKDYYGIPFGVPPLIGADV